MEDYLVTLEHMLQQAKLERIDLVLFPELFLGGYARPDLLQSFAQKRGGGVLKRVAAAAKQTGVAVGLGYTEQGDRALFNSMVVYGPNGEEIAHYRKTHLWGKEHLNFTKGTEIGPIFTFKGLRWGLLICYDVEFPENVHTLATKGGAQVILVPTALVSAFNARVTVPSRAAECGVFVAYSNHAQAQGHPGKQAEFCGLSVIAGPDGEDLVRAGAKGGGLYWADIVDNDPKFVAARASCPYEKDRQYPSFRSHL